MRVVYVTAGTVGAGHFVRGVAIERALARHGFTGSFRMFGPPLAFPVARRWPTYRPVEIHGDAGLRDPRRAAGSALAQALHAYDPDLLLIDLFWAPLHHVLPHLGRGGRAPDAWLLLRTCPPVWLVGPPGMPFEARRYQRIIAIEPVVFPEVRETIDPVVVVNPDECEDPGALARRLGATGPLHLVVHAGAAAEVAHLLARAGPTARSLDLAAEDAPFPAAAWLQGASSILAGGGYNTFWEARWLGYAARTTFVPFPRSIDDQAARVGTFGSVPFLRNGADTLARAILAG